VTLPPFHPKAEEEINAEAEYYGQKNEDLAMDFLEEVRKVAIEAANHPDQGSPYGRHTRRRRLKRFPHWLVYIASGEGIEVVAVAHPSRKPGYWTDRV
jgi:plasmid stabilization system protein ParE